MGDNTRTALVVVDMQNGFIRPSTGSGVAGSADVLTAVGGWIDRAHRQGWPVLLTRDVDPFGRTGPEGEHDAALHPSLAGRGRVVDKGPGARGGFSGFVLARGTGPGAGALGTLAPVLHEEQVTDLVVVGLAADVCVSATALDARRLGFEVTVPLAATAFVHAHPDGDEAAIDDLTSAGVRVLSPETPNRPVSQ